MANQIFKSILVHPVNGYHPFRMKSMLKTTSAEYVASRVRDATFEKLMDYYKNLFKVVAIQDLILANPNKNPPSVSLDFLSRLSQRLHLNKGPPSFLRKYPHIFHIFYDPSKSMPFVKFTERAIEITQIESTAIHSSLDVVINRLVRILSMSLTETVPLRAIFQVWRELGLPDDFEDSVLSKNPHLFELRNGNKPNTHNLRLVAEYPRNHLTPEIEIWRVMQSSKEHSKVDSTDRRYRFQQQFPPGMRLKQTFKAKVREWQRVPYLGPYDEMVHNKTNSKLGMMKLEKRAVAIVHEFLSLTVEKMIEVEKISHFRNCFGIDLNIRDLFLDHPGIFYLSTKGKRHTVFLREAYERGRLINSSPVYEARRKLFDLVMLGRHGMVIGSSKPRNNDGGTHEEKRSGESSGFKGLF